MNEIQRLLKEKREAYDAVQKLAELVKTEDRTFTQEEANMYKTLVDTMNDKQRSIEIYENMNDLNAQMKENRYDTKGKIIGSVEESEIQYRNLVYKWMREGSTGLTQDEMRILQPKTDKKVPGPFIELRTPGNVTNPTYVERTDIMTSIVAAKRYYGGWLSACDEITTAKGNPITWPTVDDTGNTGSTEAAGTDAFDNSDAIVLGYKSLNAYFVSSQGVAVDNDTLEDSEFDMGRVIGDILGERLWRKISTLATTGTGSGQAGGIASNAAGIGAPVGVIMGKHCKVSRARILQLMGKVDYAYHQAPGCGFMMNSAQMYEIAGLSTASTDDRPLWQPSMVSGVPDKIEGFPYYINNDLSLPSVHTGAARHILFGDLKAFKIRYAGSPLLVRLTERYAELLKTGFIVIQRMDSRLMSANATTYAPVKYMKRAIT